MQSRYGNCITELVTEMPRCCSSRIQSEVAWRAAFRPLTVPAIVIAPPNSSSFSVNVVLPASGCEMIAKVRRRFISGSRVSVMSSQVRKVTPRRHAAVESVQTALQYDRVFATIDRLVIAATDADLHIAQRLIQTDGDRVRRASLEK